MPKNSEFRVAMALLALILVLSLSFGSYYLYQRMGMEAPLEKQLLSLNSVEKVKIDNKNQSYDIEITLKKVDDLQVVYKSIQKAVDRALPGKVYDLHIVDRTNTRLQDFLQHLQPAVYESLANNRFMWLDEEIARRAAAQGLHYKLFVDSQHLFLQVEDGDAYAYQVIERSPESSSTVNNQLPTS
ncbi:MAG TPA: hypothetical protein VN426_05005 [Syntrophomonadaceae bacterium]|nr:hypothetical protein [Syntrophomonadaceae bacterium]